jgi:glucosamine-6-phosphate deaminase
MRLVISKNPQLWASLYIKDSIAKYKPTTDKKNFILGLPTGGTAENMYKYLVAMYKNKQISFKSVVSFNMDEYINLPKEHPQSYWFFMHNNLFNHVDIQKENINIPDGMHNNIKQFCIDYEEKIKALGGIDLFIGGVGENGHIAFNEPYSSLSSKTRDKELNQNTRLANARFFNNDINAVPKSAITVGIDTLLKAKEVLIIITGEKKSLALQQCMEGAVSHLWPISALQMHQRAIIVADHKACMEIKVKTYEYFLTLADEYSGFEEQVKKIV